MQNSTCLLKFLSTKVLYDFLRQFEGGTFNYTVANMTLRKVESLHPEVLAGGRWFPSLCAARWRIAIVVPYRNREQHLTIFLDNMHRFLQTQKLDYKIFIVEQGGTGLFNRAALMNIGYLEAMRDRRRYDCLAFPDVDLIPESLANLYGCGDQPRHLAVIRSSDKYRCALVTVWILCKYPDYKHIINVLSVCLLLPLAMPFLFRFLSALHWLTIYEIYCAI